jgi:hypothetical protein
MIREENNTAKKRLEKLNQENEKDSVRLKKRIENGDNFDPESLDYIPDEIKSQLGQTKEDQISVNNDNSTDDIMDRIKKENEAIMKKRKENN